LTQTIDWERVTVEALELLSRYIRIDTSHPAGRTIEAAHFLQAQLNAEGIESRIYETEAEGKVNLLARLACDAPVGKPFLLTSHMDVVQAVESDWQFPPFAGEVADGYIRGRGALDDKGMGVMELLTLILLKRRGAPLKRDVLLLGTCDEEIGSVLGARWLLEHHFADIDPEFVLDEGGYGMRGFFAAGDVFPVSIGEKRILWLRMIARAEPGHASMPWRGAATHRLVRAANAILSQPEEDRECGPVAELIHQLGPTGRQELKSNRSTEPLFRDTMSLTMLKGGYKINILPEQAEMSFDCRLLPDTDEHAFVSNLQQIVSDPSIQFEVTWPGNRPVMSPWSQATLFTAIREAAHARLPNALVTPSICVGGTDSRYFRDRGVPAYGFVPCLLTAEDLKGVHGLDEKLSIENLRLGLQVVFDVAARVAVAEA
jgi:acetylornithine deacetylase/succinyl-diaminopimelate desuccinylase-like protein